MAVYFRPFSVVHLFLNIVLFTSAVMEPTLPPQSCQTYYCMMSFYILWMFDLAHQGSVTEPCIVSITQKVLGRKNKRSFETAFLLFTHAFLFFFPRDGAGNWSFLLKHTLCNDCSFHIRQAHVEGSNRKCGINPTGVQPRANCIVGFVPEKCQVSIHSGVQKLPLELYVCPAKELRGRSDDLRGLLLDGCIECCQLQPGESEASEQVSCAQTGPFVPDSKQLAHNPNLLQFDSAFF